MQLMHATRRFIFGVIIALNTVLFGLNLFKDQDTQAALVNFLVCCVSWIGIYFINWSEQLELSEKEEKTGDDDDEQ